MTDTVAQNILTEPLARFFAQVQTPRVLHWQPAERMALIQAGERVRAQFCGSVEPILVVALVGGTGVGKSSLINALAGSAIAPVGELRPTTDTLYVYHHRTVPPPSLPQELTQDAVLVEHDRPELRTKVLVDTPDLDSFVRAHRARTRRLLKATGLVLYVFSPEKYLDERTWSVLREELRFSASAVILNKSDQVSSPEELASITTDLRRAFAAVGLGDIRIFRTCARVHGAGNNGDGRLMTPAGDDTAALHAFLERELHTSEVARLQRAQQENTYTHLRDLLDCLVPGELLARFDQVVERAHQQGAAVHLVQKLRERLSAVERELTPLVIVRQHERFRGPFRTWLAVADFLRFGLPRTVRQLVSGGIGGRYKSPTHLLLQDQAAIAEDCLRQEAYSIQKLLYEQQLPIERWHLLTLNPDGKQLIADLAAALEATFNTTAAGVLQTRRPVVWIASLVGSLVPAVLVLGGLYLLGRDLLTGTYEGFSLLGHLMAMAVLFFTVLQSIVGVLLPGTQRLSQDLGQQAVYTVLSRTIDEWLSTYRTELQADLNDLGQLVQILRAEVVTRPMKDY